MIICGFEQPDAFTLVQFGSSDHLLKWCERSDLNEFRRAFTPGLG